MPGPRRTRQLPGVLLLVLLVLQCELQAGTGKFKIGIPGASVYGPSDPGGRRSLEGRSW